MTIILNVVAANAVWIPFVFWCIYSIRDTERIQRSHNYVHMFIIKGMCASSLKNIWYLKYIFIPVYVVYKRHCRNLDMDK